MSQVIFENPVKRITGKVEPQSNMSFRRNGEKVFTYTLQHPRTEKDFSDHEKKYRRSFGEASKEASRLCHDTRYAERWNDYQEHGYLSRHKYVLHLIVNGEIESA